MVKYDRFNANEKQMEQNTGLRLGHLEHLSREPRTKRSPAKAKKKKKKSRNLKQDLT